MSDYTLSRIIPQRTETAKFLWIQKDWMNYGKFREAREKMDCTEMYKRCWWCRHKFEDEENIALACIGKKGNRPICSKCAREAMGDSDEC